MPCYARVGEEQSRVGWAGLVAHYRVPNRSRAVTERGESAGQMAGAGRALSTVSSLVLPKWLERKQSHQRECLAVFGASFVFHAPCSSETSDNQVLSIR